ncbi:hypothetical protein [Hyphomicrobium sp. DY-1]|uniref:hypothetical protein n=1 Tax=Hyphomicrobium sp. DY-1 TaxID=3075650 RepID=UPI0039C30755
MSFAFPKGARDFFKGIDKQSGQKFIMFDQYYCCLLVGLEGRQIGNEEDLEGEPFIVAYPEDYRAQADIIAGLLIDAELDRKAIAPEDKASIEQEMVKLLNPTSATRLSDEGNRLLNLYAAEGFRLVHDRMMPPGSLEEFLVAYHGFWYSAGELTTLEQV